MPRMDFKPTAEQDKITVAAADGKNLVLIAVAGSGKTSTLRLIANDRPDVPMLYLAFNKAIQTDAEGSFPSNVKCQTAHSVAYGWARKNAPHAVNRLRTNMKPWDAPKAINMPGANQYRGTAIVIGERAISATAAYSLVIQTLGRFCRSDATEVGFKHVPLEFAPGSDDQKQFEAFILGFARKVWADWQNPKGKLATTHDYYLKLWSLACPVLAYKVVLFDEAQDADPAIAHVIRNQPADTQIIMVGDPAQAIYGWRGAVDAMTPFTQEPGTVTLTLTQSFRFGEAVAHEANRFLDLLDNAVKVVGNPDKNSTVGMLDKADAILCRTNAAVIEYAMDAQAKGQTVAIVGGTGEIEQFCKSAEKLIRGKGMPSGDLAGFDSWADVREHAEATGDATMKRMVRMVDTYGTDAILRVCEQAGKEGDADVIVSTAHKAKGREWDAVKIAGDFLRSATADEAQEPSAADLMLMYVAVTRAKLALDATALSMIGAVA